MKKTNEDLLHFLELKVGDKVYIWNDEGDEYEIVLTVVKDTVDGKPGYYLQTGLFDETISQNLDYLIDTNYRIVRESVTLGDTKCFDYPKCNMCPLCSVSSHCNSSSLRDSLYTILYNVRNSNIPQITEICDLIKIELDKPYTKE